MTDKFATKVSDALFSVLHDVMLEGLDAKDAELYQQEMWNMTNHKPTEEKAEIMEILRSDFKVTMGGIIKFVPAGRERSLALTKLEEALMWTMAGIAREGFAIKDEDRPNSLADLFEKRSPFPVESPE